MDIKLMFLTLKILLMPDSTEGIESTQITAMKQSNAELLERREKLDQEARERIEKAYQERAKREAEILERQQMEAQKAEETREEEAAKGSEERWRDGEETVSGESG
jgi:tRNA A37 N6-isopentenylltransferase MiaA